MCSTSVRVHPTIATLDSRCSHHCVPDLRASTMDLTGVVTVLLILISTILIYSTWTMTYRKRNLPPGPTPLPLIGNILNIKRGEKVTSMMQFWKQYGSMYTLYFGSRPVVFLCGYQTVKEALVDHKDEFGARGSMETFRQFTKDDGITMANGERWKLMRTFTFKTLKNFGFGKKSIEENIQEEAQCIVQEFMKSKGQPVETTRQFMDALSNVLCTILIGDRFEYKVEKFSKVLEFLDEISKLMSTTWGQFHNIFPTLMSYIPGPHKNIVKLSDEVMEFISERVKASQETLDPSSPRHLIDCFLNKMEKEKNDPNSEFNMRNLLVVVHNLLMAAIETVAITLRYALLIFIKYPEIQAKLQEEIDRVIGRERIPSNDDRVNMPYTNAVIHEVQRFSDLAPISMPHKLTKDTKFRGYLLPKGTEIYPLLCTVHRDPECFSTPYKFNPNHFLDENSQFKNNNAYMPFSAGKRVCPGENLARMELFIFLTTILQNFKLTSETEFTESDIAPKMRGFINFPIEFELSFIPR